MVEKTAFVTGGTGFLGLNLIEQLTALNWRVVALHRPTSDLRYIKRFPVALVEGDVLDPVSLRGAMPENPDAVFHVAADISVWSRRNERQTRINVNGTRNLIEAALAVGAKRFVHTSSWVTYGLEQGDIHEGLPQLGGRSWINYNRSKYLAEQEVRVGLERGLPAIILNPSHIFGRYDRHNWARLIIGLQKRWVPGAPPGMGTFCHAEEVARAHIAAAERGRTGQNYLLGGATATFVEVFRTIAEVTGWKLASRSLPAFAFRLPARLAVALAALTGQEPEMTPEGVEMVIARAKVVSDLAQRELIPFFINSSAYL